MDQRTRALIISDADSTVSAPNLVITDLHLQGADPSLTPDREITSTGQVPAALSYRADATGNHSGGITIYAGSGAYTILVAVDDNNDGGSGDYVLDVAGGSDLIRRGTRGMISYSGGPG